MEIELMSRVAQIIVLGPSFLGIAIDRPQCKGFRMRHSAQAQNFFNYNYVNVLQSRDCKHFLVYLD